MKKIVITLLVVFPILVQAEFQISTKEGKNRMPDMASDGRNFLVVWWWDDGTTFHICGQFVSPEGELIDSNFTIAEALSDTLDYLTHPRVAWGDGKYLVIWHVLKISTYAYLYGRFILPDGTMDSTFVIYPTWHPYALNSSGGDFLVVWKNSGGTALCGRIVLQDGTLADTFTVADVAYPFSSEPIGIGWGGEDYLVVWNEMPEGYLQIYGRLVSLDGVPIGAKFLISGDNYGTQEPEVGFSGENYLVVWQHEHPWMFDVSGQIISPSGELIGEQIAACHAGLDQGHPSLSYDGNNFLVVFQDTRPEGYTDHIQGQFISATGELIDTDFVVAPPRCGSPHVSWGGETFLVVWADTSETIHGTLIPSVGVEENSQLTLGSSSFRAFPNPFGQFLSISGSGDEIEVYDGCGRLVRIIKSMVWNGRDTYGRPLPCGVYLLRRKNDNTTYKVVKIR